MLLASRRQRSATTGSTVSAAIGSAVGDTRQALCAAVGRTLLARSTVRPTVSSAIGATVSTAIGSTVSHAIGSTVSPAIGHTGYTLSATIGRALDVARAAVRSTVGAAVGTAILDARDAVGAAISGAFQVVDAFTGTLRAFTHRSSIFVDHASAAR